ncbi:hypothetical protein H5410_015554 [Solanum commersonii]|uniref:Uncharacterized protein n=1 Tax=Solanum commersonii TaxID=4109 RepID=A0A9J5ZUR9_SOLCO|nr:hypothetical protein H5410_015554 [Solanum commersonii]
MVATPAYKTNVDPIYQTKNNNEKFFGVNWMIGPRAAPSSPHSPFPNMNLESSKPSDSAWPGHPKRPALQKAKLSIESRERRAYRSAIVTSLFIVATIAIGNKVETSI